jgi:DNA-binding GntR family transcriptional regulator
MNLKLRAFANVEMPFFGVWAAPILRRDNLNMPTSSEHTSISTPLVAKTASIEHAIASRTSDATSQSVEKKTGSLVDLVVLALRDELIHGRIVPGQRLIESELMARLSVSRVTIRDAIRHLSSIGVLTMEHNRGASVRRFNKTDLLDMLNVHEMLVGLGARLACLRLRYVPSLPQKLRQIHTSMLDADHAGNMGSYLELYPQFHDTIVDAADNQPLRDVRERLLLYMFRNCLLRVIDRELLTQWHSEHQAIIDAIAAASPERAEAAMRHHVSQFIRVVMDAPAEKLF